MYFGVATIALFKPVSKIETISEILIFLFIIHLIYAMLFAIAFKTNPIK